MKHISVKAWILAAAVVGASHPAWAQDEADRFYDRKAEGWFWYATEPVEQEEPEAPIPEPAVQAAVAPAESVPAEPAPPAAFSAQWFRDNLPRYKDAAWDNPTIENVRAFLYLQRFALDRSEQFADTTELAVVGDPFLDEITRRPAATFASQQVDRDAGTARNALLGRIAERVGIFFFYRSDDDYSTLQAPLVKMLEQSGGFSVIPVALDGKALAGGLFPAFRADAGHAAQLGIVTTPALYLASPDGQFAPIGQGAMSLPELNQRILVAARRNGWVSEDEFNRTRPVLNLQNNLAERLAPSEGGADLAHLVHTSADDTGFVPPEQLGRYIRSKLQEH